MAIGVGLIGAGNFARDEHFPAILAAETLELRAVYSRSLKSAQSLDTDVELYSEDSGTGKSLDDFLAREDIQAVIIALPIPSQPAVIRKALSAGKHVLSEKPIGPDLAQAQEMIKWYHETIDAKKTTWSVAENFRYMNSFNYAADKVKDLGPVKGFDVNISLDIKDGNKAYETSWRKTPTHQGGFVLDAGVHFVAAMRLILGSDRFTTVVAKSELKRAWLPPVDTVDATLETENGVKGTLAMTFAAEKFKKPTYTFTCEKGEVTVSFSDVTINGETKDLKDERTGVPPEVRKWGEALAKGEQNAKQTPEEALADLEVVEAMLRSGEKDGLKMDLKLQL